MACGGVVPRHRGGLRPDRGFRLRAGHHPLKRRHQFNAFGLHPALVLEDQMLFGEEHVSRYVGTNGQEGHDWNGAVVLILTTTGRKSGEQHSTPLIYGRHGDDYLVVASLGGADHHPAWYLNLEEKPDVQVQVKGDKFAARARTATPVEKPELWRTMVAQWADYDRYQKRTSREIPVVVLERT